MTPLLSEVPSEAPDWYGAGCDQPPGDGGGLRATAGVCPGRADLGRRMHHHGATNKVYIRPSLLFCLSA